MQHPYQTLQHNIGVAIASRDLLCSIMARWIWCLSHCYTQPHPLRPYTPHDSRRRSRNRALYDEIPWPWLDSILDPALVRWIRL